MGCKNNNSLVRTNGWFNIVKVHDIVESSVSITYPSNMIKDGSLDDKYIVETLLPYKCWTLFHASKKVQN